MIPFWAAAVAAILSALYGYAVGRREKRRRDPRLLLNGNRFVSIDPGLPGHDMEAMVIGHYAENGTVVIDDFHWREIHQ